MCGIAGILGQSPVNYQLYEALSLLQHRGQDSCGIATYDKGQFRQHKGLGMVYDVFDQRHMDALTGNLGIGHVRYPTAGTFDSSLTQPLYVNAPYGICLAHNGNLTNAPALRKRLRVEMRHLNTDSDSEVLLNVFAAALQRRGGLLQGTEEIFSAVANVNQLCKGAYAVVLQIAGYGLVGFRDPHGIRPLILGRRETLDGPEYMLSSESVAARSLGFEIIRDVGPGGAVYIDLKGQIFSRQCSEEAEFTPCIFEHIYLARPDSIMDGISVYQARLSQGDALAKKLMRTGLDSSSIDVVIPVPDTGRISAQTIAHGLGVPFREGLTKNRYVGRTFIMPHQEERMKSVRRKLTTIELEFRDKNVLLVDDSIVRGTTSKQIVQMAREAGAKRVFLVSAAPAVRYPNVYGIDMPTASELIAHGRSVEKVRDTLGVDHLVYQDIEDLKEASRKGNGQIRDFECSVFDGRYVTGDIDEKYLSRLANHKRQARARRNRGNSAKRARRKGNGQERVHIKPSSLV